MIKIKTYRLARRGQRGFILTIPKVWADDLKLDTGDIIDVYRDEKDHLILVAQVAKEAKT